MISNFFKIRSFIIEAAIISLAALVLSLIGNAVSPKGIALFPDLKAERELMKHFVMLSAEEMREAMNGNDVIVIDSRSKNHFDKSHIKSAINIPYKDADKYYDTVFAYIPKETKIIIYCSGENCSLSLRLAKKIKDWDFTNINILDGGFADWTKKKFEIEAEGAR